MDKIMVNRIKKSKQLAYIIAKLKMIDNIPAVNAQHIDQYQYMIDTINSAIDDYTKYI